MWYSGLNNKNLWKIFNDISRIPRESGNEEGIRSFLLSWAEAHKLKAVTDKIGNGIIYCPATKGMENLPCIALQGHMDMVCVKTSRSKHDFEKDPISIYIDGPVIRAKGTSLGADYGIAVAMILDIFSDKDAVHGPLEGIFTVSEETGMDGANNLDPSLIDARRMINLDSEEEDIIYIGCAGGIEVDASMKCRWTEPSGEAVKVEVSGLLGGHSGAEIHKERANAIKVLARYLRRLPVFQLASIEGGTKRNVIPSEASAVITVPDKAAAESIAKNLLDELKNELKDSDPGATLSITGTEMPEKVIKRKASAAVADALFAAPHGVGCMNTAINVVETSDNLAIVSMNDEKISVVFSVRSTIDSKKFLRAEEIQTIMESFGFKTKLTGSYPAWEPSLDPSFRKEVAKAYKAISGVKPGVTIMHAGLECGIINSLIPGMDSISIGPELHGVHSINENLNIASAERVADIVKKMLPSLK